MDPDWLLDSPSSTGHAWSAGSPGATRSPSDPPLTISVHIHCPQTVGPGGWAIAMDDSSTPPLHGHDLQTTSLRLTLTALLHLSAERPLLPSLRIVGADATVRMRWSYGALGHQFPSPLAPTDSPLWAAWWHWARDRSLIWVPTVAPEAVQTLATSEWALGHQRLVTARLRGRPEPAPSLLGDLLEAPLPPWAIPLGFATWPDSLTAIRTAFRTRVFAEHPDYGGSVAAFQALLAARDAAETWWQSHHRS